MKKLVFFFSFFLLIGLGTTQLNAQTVFVTKTGEKYHKGSCHYLKQSKISIDLKEAINLSYDPCKVCKPVSTNKYGNNLDHNKKVAPSTTKAVATRCSGRTKSGSRCKRKTKNSNGRCYQH